MFDTDTHPKRPHISLLFISFIFIWLELAFLLEALLIKEAHFVALSILGALVCMGIFYYLQALRGLLLSLGLILLSAVLAITQTYSFDESKTKLKELSAQNLAIEIASDISYSSYKNSYTVKLLESGALIKLEIDPKMSELYLGERFYVSGAFKDFGESFWEKIYTRQGIVSSYTLTRIESSIKTEQSLVSPILNLRKQLLHIVDPQKSEARSLFAGVVLGYSSDLKTRSLYRDFSETGLSHLIAVSGSHLVVVNGLILFVLKALKLNRSYLIGALLVASLIYVVFTGFQISALRSWFMLFISLSALLIKRRADGLSGLAFAGLVLILHDPLTALSLSFALSALSVMALIVFTPLLISYIKGLEGVIGKKAFVVCEGLCLTLCAQAASLALVIPTFNTLSLISPLANILVSPLISLGLIVGLIALLLYSLFPSLGEGMVLVSEHIFSAATTLTSYMSSLPLSSLYSDANQFVLIALSLIITLLVLIYWPRPSFKVIRYAGWMFGVLTMYMIFILSYQMLPGVYALDVGQGDSILLKSKNKSLLVDTGAHKKVIDALYRNHVKHLDYLMITHLDKDHIGALDELSQHVDIDYLLFAKGVFEQMDEKRKIELSKIARKGMISLSAGDSFKLANFNCMVLWPSSYVDGEDNEDSLVLYAHYQNTFTEFSCLLTGDAEKDELEEILKNYKLSEVDILKVGHHGSRNGAYAWQMATLKPKLSLISCGKNNRYGHPHKETLKLLEDEGSNVLRTDLQGDVGLKDTGILVLPFWQHEYQKESA